jgi:DNA polymerase III subunit epsilon
VIGWLRERYGMGSVAAAAARWVVVDCETSGLDPARDRLISLAAVAVQGGRIFLDRTFSVMVHQPQPSARNNILVHGIGQERQAAGMAPQTAVRDFLAFAGHSPRVAWRAEFDRAVVSRALRDARLDESGLWLDLAALLPVLFQGRAAAEAPLERWLGVFAIDHPARHDALADAFATAHLLQIALSEAGRQGFRSVGAVLRAARAARWTGG